MTNEQALDILRHNWTRVDNPNYTETELDEAFFIAIQALQTDIVRCGECKYCCKYIDGHSECRLLENLKTVPCTYVRVENDDYCSHGERKESEDTK